MGSSQSSTARTSQEEQIRQVDGGSLSLEDGVYTAPQDWKKSVVRALQLARKLAPYYKGLDDYDQTWSTEQLLTELRSSLPSNAYNQALLTSVSDPSGYSNPASTTNSGRGSPSRPSSYIESNSPGSSPVKPRRPRAVTVDSSSNIHQVQRPRVPFAVTLYQNAVECPICFLYYPSNIATTRCCRQPICTECFVQIRRPNPHPPVVHADDPQPPAEHPETLIMESPVCPYCNLPDFGIIYEAPNFALPRQPFQSFPANQRDIPPTDTRVILTDMIRPDWSAKLQRAKDRAARRAANAALITAHLQRQERRAQEARARAGGSSTSGRSRRRDYEAIEEAQLAEAIRLSMLEDEQRRTKGDAPAPSTSAQNTSEEYVSTTAALDVQGSSRQRPSSESYSRSRGLDSMPMPELLYAPPSDSYNPPTTKPFSSAAGHYEDLE